MRTHAAKQNSRLIGECQFYKDESEPWRWRIKSSNGNILAVSSESYKRLKDAKQCVISTMKIINRIDFMGCVVS